MMTSHCTFLPNRCASAQMSCHPDLQSEPVCESGEGKSMEQSSMEQSSMEQSSMEQSSMGQSSMGQSSMGQSSMEQSSMEQSSVSSSEPSSEQPQCHTPASTKLDAHPTSPGLNTKQCGLPDTPMCRICHDSGAQEELLSPCECSGSLATIHRSCLEHWLSASATSHCELCHHQFSLQRKSRRLLEWLRDPRLGQEKRTLLGDMVCFLLITPLATISGWLCLRGAIDHLHYSSRLEAVGLIALTVALFTIYLFWTLVSLRYHCRLYSEWRQSNQRVVLLQSHSEAASWHSSAGPQRGKQPSKESIV